MRLFRNNTKFISRFVLAFICLNLGGVFCLAYCGQGMNDEKASMTMSLSCPHHKQAQTVATDSEMLTANVTFCCSLPVSLIAAPLEKSHSITLDSLLVSVVTVPEFRPVFLSTSRTPATNVYRPPPLDRRGARLLNCIIRI